MTAHEFLSRLECLPDLLALARQQAEINYYPIQEKLRAQCRMDGRPFHYSMPMRHFYACPVCGRQATDILHELEDPRRGRKIGFPEVVLHRAQAHDIPPGDDLADFLAACLEETE